MSFGLVLARNELFQRFEKKNPQWSAVQLRYPSGGSLRIAAVTLLSLSCIAYTKSVPVSHERVLVRISPNTSWATTGLLIGTADVYPESIVVVVDSTHITQISHEAGRSTYHLDSMTVSLAIPSGNNWGTSAESAALTITDSLAERVAFSLGKVRFHIPRPPGQPIRGSWLMVTFFQTVAPALVPREQQGGSTTYAHSARDIFSRLTVASNTTAPAPSVQVPVRISSLQTNFATKGLLIGTATAYPESVVVAFDSTYVMQYEHKAGRSTEHLDSMTVGLAIVSDGKWRINTTSAALTIADSLAERVTFSLGKVRFNIPRRPSESLRSSWLVVTFHQIVAPSLVPLLMPPGVQPGRSTTYAHSARAIFSRLHGR